MTTQNETSLPDGTVGCLSGVRILDLSRLAPGPYCSMLLADMGADVTVVGGGAGSLPIASLSRGKRLIGLDLKSAAGRKAFLLLASEADVVIEGYRPGVTKRLGIDYETLSALNPSLVYCSITGYGQTGPMSDRAGHDINYVAMSGAIGAFGPMNGVPAVPLNLLADFAGGSLFAAIGILGALHARQRSGTGGYIDASMVDGCLSLMTMHFQDWGQSVLKARGDGLVAGNAPYYRCYECADGKFVAVGALEPKFFVQLWTGLGFDDPVPAHLDRGTWQEMTSRFETAFASRSRDEWTERFRKVDACVTPVIDPDEARTHPQNTQRHPFLQSDGVAMAPKITSSLSNGLGKPMQDETEMVLRELGLEPEEIKLARAATSSADGLSWPPL
ncbi:CaiB/BaiF CoA transferase family protein [Aureimonas jatrophae]|uniref:Alpha-methylacyl-CoA racemase n=1 Tax=Aureimonas jatrophae TaxID=1166073 RepID=A0A1H0EH54_9HYPH|nr:CaiB/BaiF CoA-transferase family protein [Aureimonas jatrophae]MBB3952833.1 alpha-methylacyl-CoA racemase [Aureimonas jatrophae]SDN81787.1 alpha-methylacyl-CoA racemase [Aureimonas jatrophae]